MKSKEGLVSVYIPTHNRSRMLKNAIESVLNQNYQNIEIIVVDDGSTDETEQVADYYVKAERVVYIKNELPKGACAARNRALQVAKGEFITGLDDDDLFGQSRISQLVHTFEQAEYSCVCTGITERTIEGDITRCYDNGLVTLNKLLHHNILGNQVLTRTRYLKAINGFDETMPSFQDYDTWVRLVSKFGNAYKLNTSSYIWITSHESERITTNSEKKQSGYEMFFLKHKVKMRDAHLKTHSILKRRIFNQSFNFKDLITLTTADNWRQSLTLFVDRSLPSIKKILNKARVK